MTPEAWASPTRIAEGIPYRTTVGSRTRPGRCASSDSLEGWCAQVARNLQRTPSGGLDAMLAQRRAKGADVVEETQDMAGVGVFGWVTDPEGIRIELWQRA